MQLMGLTMHIDAPVDDVFDFMADVENERDWNPDLRSVERIGTGPIERGAEWDGTYRGMGAMRIRLDEYDRQRRRLAFSTTGSRMNMTFSFSFGAAEGGEATDIAVDAEVEPKGGLRLAAPLLGPMMRRTFAKRPAQLSAAMAQRKAGAGPLR